MSAWAAATMADESYVDLLRSGPHWLFELTLEILTAPLAFAIGWVWRNRLLRHVHHDLGVLSSNRRDGQPSDPEHAGSDAVEPSGSAERLSKAATGPCPSWSGKPPDRLHAESVD